MKDSGVEWLGEVPEHWEVKPIKHLAELNPKKSEITLNKNLMCNFLPMEKLKTGTVLLDEMKVISDVYDGYTYFRNNDILMAKVTPCFENHNIAIVKELENNIGFGSTEIYVLRVKTGGVNNFLFYRLQESNFMAVATSAMTGAGGLKRVPSDVLNNYLIAIPDFETQETIANYIDVQTTKIDNLIDKSNSAIELMQERRTALISAAVTGKIDVRHWQVSE
jgi:type I restriction enzyme S subunit